MLTLPLWDSWWLYLLLTLVILLALLDHPSKRLGIKVTIFDLLQFLLWVWRLELHNLGLLSIDLICKVRVESLIFLIVRRELNALALRSEELAGCMLASLLCHESLQGFALHCWVVLPVFAIIAIPVRHSIASILLSTWINMKVMLKEVFQTWKESMLLLTEERKVRARHAQMCALSYLHCSSLSTLSRGHFLPSSASCWKDSPEHGCWLDFWVYEAADNCLSHRECLGHERK